MNPDNLRAWMDARDFGELSSNCPLQSGIVYNSIFPSAEKQQIIDTLLISETKDIFRDTSNNHEIYDIDCIVNDIITFFPLSEYKSNSSCSNYNAIKFIHDLTNMTNTSSTPSPPPPLPETKSDNNVYKKAEVVPPISNPSTNVSQTNPIDEKRNLFVSAKDKFTAEGGKLKATKTSHSSNGTTTQKRDESNSDKSNEEELPKELEHCSKALVEKIKAEIVHRGQSVSFDDIAGLDFAKKCVQELICWPMLRPDLFVGLRALPKGILLFGPPGTGKTLIGKAIAHQARATFFSISASSLTSKWIGEGEATVRTLFAVASYYQPSVVFMDEVDSLLIHRSSDENEASRRIKTEFLVQLDGTGTNENTRVVIVGATNRPEELDEAARRRFIKRLYIPLPDVKSRFQLVGKLLSECKHCLNESEIMWIVERTEGYSGADIRSLCTEAAMAPIREIAFNEMDLSTIREDDVSVITFEHFKQSLDVVCSSVSTSDLKRYIDWNVEFGTYKRLA